MGKFIVHKNVYSKDLDNYRDIIIYIPDSYYNSEKKYPVIYFHDGMEAFFKEWALSGESLRANETVDMLSRIGEIPEAICVGISNKFNRFSEYSHYHFHSDEFGIDTDGLGEKYENFILKEIIPMIEETYRTNGERYLVGSSMGGVVSLMIGARNQDVFKGVVAMSSYLEIDGRKPTQYIKESDLSNMPKLYLDYGAKEDKEVYAIQNEELREVLLEKGLKEGEDFLFIVDEEGAHSEKFWAKRLPNALKYIMND